MDTILIADLEVYCQVGVTAAERAHPQRLLVNVEMEHDFTSARARDNLAETIDYHAVCQRLLAFVQHTQWSLIETLASDMASAILDEFRPRSVTIEVKKFVIPQARHVAVRTTQTRQGV